MLHPPRSGRRSIRLRGFDYSAPRDYFVTLCAQGRKCLFGDIIQGQMRWNEAGDMVKRWWAEVRHKFPNVELDTFIVMPNHVHGIIRIVGADLRVRPRVGAHTGAPLRRRPSVGASRLGRTPLHAIVRWFKTMTTNDYVRRVKQSGWPRFSGRLWQRNYYEHVIRTEAALWKIREYICANPLAWPHDPENPGRSETRPDEIEEIIERDCSLDDDT